MWLYMLTNKINGKRYIGTSVNPISHRISRHVYAAKCGRKDMAISSAIRKYGIENFQISELGQSADYASLMNMEVEAIKSNGTIFPSGYNLAPGGEGLRRPCSETTKKLISEKAKGRKPWNLGNLAPSTQQKRERRGFKAGAPKGYVPWNKGLKTVPLSKEHKKSIALGVSEIRATKFWISRKGDMR